MPFDPNEFEEYKSNQPSAFNPDEYEKSKNPGLWESAKMGFAQKDLPKEHTTGEGIAHFAGENILPTLGAIGGEIVNPLSGGVVGATAGRALQKGIAQGSGMAPVESPGQIAVDVIAQGAGQYLGGKYIPPMAKGVGRFAKNVASGVGRKILQPVLQATSGVSKEAFDTLVDHPSEVWKYIGADIDSISSAAKTFKGVIDANVVKAGQAYKKLITKALGNKTEIMEGIQEHLNPVLKDIQDDFGYNLPSRMSDPKEQAIFNKYVARIAKLIPVKATEVVPLVDKYGNQILKTVERGAKANVEDVYYLQKDLQDDIARSTFGDSVKPIGAALGRLKAQVMKYLSDKVPEIAEANKIYSSAMETSEDLSRVMRADNPAMSIRNAFINKTETHDAMLRAADGVAGARKALEDVLYGSSAKEFTPLMRTFPGTGVTTTAVGGEAVLLAHASPISLMAALAAPFAASPRAVGTGVRAAVGTMNALTSAAQSKIAQTAGNLGIRAGMVPISDSVRQNIPNPYPDQEQSGAMGAAVGGMVGFVRAMANGMTGWYNPKTMDFQPDNK